MIRKYFLYCFCLATILFISCNGNKSNPIYIDTDYSTINKDVEIEMNTIEVPFREEGGIKILHVKVNGVGFDMIFDPGCSLTLISLAEAEYLAQKGFLTQEDILGVSQSMIADGSIVENMVINLRKVSIDGKIDYYNVRATVSNNMSAPLLLGNAVLDRAVFYTIDNSAKKILFKLK